MAPRPRPKPRTETPAEEPQGVPAPDDEPQGSPVPDRSASGATLAEPDTGSRAQAKAAHERTLEQQPVPLIVPVNPSGRPLVQISMSASELVPTGQYANVSIGPVTATAFIDIEREIAEGQAYFTKEERETLAAALNQLAEAIEVDVLAVQRALVDESLRSQD